MSTCGSLDLNTRIFKSGCVGTRITCIISSNMSEKSSVSSVDHTFCTSWMKGTLSIPKLISEYPDSDLGGQSSSLNKGKVRREKAF